MEQKIDEQVDFTRKTFFLKENDNASELIEETDEEVLGDEILNMIANGNGTKEELNTAKDIAEAFVKHYKSSIIDDEKLDSWSKILKYVNEDLEK